MKTKKIPMRTCVVTREKFPKQELIRVVKDNLGNVSVDETGKANGRGAYVCRNSECLMKAIKSKGLDRSFKVHISDEIYDKLKEELSALE